MWYNIPWVFHPFPWIFSREVPSTDYIRLGNPKHISLMLPEVYLMVSLLFPLTNYPSFFNLTDFPKKNPNLFTPSYSFFFFLVVSLFPLLFSTSMSEFGLFDFKFSLLNDVFFIYLGIFNFAPTKYFFLLFFFVGLTVKKDYLTLKEGPTSV